MKRQSGLGWPITQVGSNANPATRKIHRANGEAAIRGAGRLLQRVRKRYAHSRGTTHPKLYCASTAQYCDNWAISMYQSTPKTAKPKMPFNRFATCPQTEMLPILKLRFLTMNVSLIFSVRLTDQFFRTKVPLPIITNCAATGNSEHDYLYFTTENRSYDSPSCAIA